jgi:hypothetical protein
MLSNPYGGSVTGVTARRIDQGDCGLFIAVLNFNNRKIQVVRAADKLSGYANG